MIDVLKWVCDNVRFGLRRCASSLRHASAGQKTPRCHRSHIMTAEPYGRILTDESYALSGPMLLTTRTFFGIGGAFGAILSITSDNAF
jgi:hypothetical protein